MRYVLLHSLAHALIRQFSLECGYTTASIRERIYSRPRKATARSRWPASCFTLPPRTAKGRSAAWLASASRRFSAVIWTRPWRASGCARPTHLCAEHHPYRDSLTLHGAACHACLFLPETSCERGNKYLDRSVLVKTVEKDSLAFFPASSDSETGSEDVDVVKEGA